MAERKPYVGLTKLNYREQDDLPCCGNCEHCYVNADYDSEWLECLRTTKRQTVSCTGLCDEFAPEEGPDVR